MTGLDFYSKHNMVAYLEKNDGNTEFHEIMDFVTNSSIYFALTVSPIVLTLFVEQFWTSAKSRTINNISYIDAIVAGKPVTISEASIRSDLLFDDADGIDTLNNQAIFDTIQLMGCERDLNILTFNKALFSPQWKFLFHTMNYCISFKSTSWDQIPTNIATAVICLATNQKYNFSKFIFNGMMRHLDASKKFVTYPRFLQIFSKSQLRDVSVPMDYFPVLTLTKKVFSFMVKKGKNFSGNVTPLFNSMLVQSIEDEGEVSERPSESQPKPSPTHPTEDQPESQPVPSPRPYSPNPIRDSNPEGSGRNHGEIAKEEGYGETKEKKECIQTGEESCQIFQQSIQRNTDWDVLDTDLDETINEAMNYTFAQDEGKTDSKVEEPKTSSKTKEFHLSGATLVVEDKGSAEKGGSIKGTDLQQSTVKPNEGTDKQNGGTDKTKGSTNSFVEGTAKIKDQVSGESDTSTVPTMTSTPTPTVFGDDETIAQVLVTMSQNKPLPKIDPKAKGKGMIKEEDESDTESEDITEAEKKFNMLANDEEMAKKTRFLLRSFKKKREKNSPSKRERSCFMIPLLHKKDFLLNKDLRSDENFITIGSVEDERIIKGLNKKAAGIKKAGSIKKESKEEEGTKKRKLGTRKKMKSRKRKFRQDTSEDDETNSEKENDELGLCLIIAPDEDKEVDYEILDKKYPIIEWKSDHLGIKPQYDETKDLEEINQNVVIRSNGQRRYFSTLMRVLSIFDRDDLSVVYQLVMDRYCRNPINTSLHFITRIKN
ncbi:hypothetical protein Tco_0877757 [Tanacetum coccineum]|uniref:Uncharacterized protein n=1 Tax=Tanacetum coccineum TaxID=301880 RepID=A0ABQ5BYQ5_9ASTR